MSQQERGTSALPPTAGHHDLLLAWAALLIGLAVTAFAAVRMKSDADRDARREFRFACSEIRAKILSRLDVHRQVLYSAVSLFAASETVTRQNWHDFVAGQRIDRYLPGIQGLGFNVRVRREDLAHYVKAIRAQGFPQYRVHPSGERDEYAPTIYLEPFSGSNLRAFGYDALYEAVRREAAERARDTNAAALTGKITLVQEGAGDVQAGGVMFAPVYRRGMPTGTVEQRRDAILGWVSNPYRMDDLMGGILDGWDWGESGRVRLEVFDEREAPEALIYDSQPDGPDTARAESAPGLRLSIVEAGRRWVLRFRQAAGQGAVHYAEAWLVALAGTCISLLVSRLLISRRKTLAKAAELARQRTAELRESEGRYRALVENIRMGITLIDRDHRILMINQTHCEFFKKKAPEDFLGKLCFEEFEKRDAVCPHCPGTQALATGQPAEVKATGIRDDGTQMLVRIHAFPVAGADGKINSFIEVVEDITEHEQAEERHGVVLKTAMDGFVVVNTHGQIIEANDAFSEISGYSQQELLEMSIADLEVLERPQDVLGRIQRIRSDGRARFETRHRRKDGQIIDVEVSIRYMGEPSRLMFNFLRDVTDLRRAEKAVEAARIKVLHVREQEQRRVARELHDSVGQHLVAMKISLASAGLTDQARECSEIIQEIRRLCRGLYPPALEAIGLVSALTQIGRACEPRTEFHLEYPPELKAARFAPLTEISLFRIAQEAVANALRHSRAQTIEVHLRQAGEQQIEMEVVDDGCGFDPAGPLGDGIGLQTMRDRAQLAGGTLDIVSGPGQTRVRVRVPLKAETDSPTSDATGTHAT